MQDKLRAIITSPTSLSIIGVFVLGGLQAIIPQLQGNVLTLVKDAILLLGLIYHPTDMVAGRSIPKRG